jgi:hypothetical protein
MTAVSLSLPGATNDQHGSSQEQKPRNKRRTHYQKGCHEIGHITITVMDE